MHGLMREGRREPVLYSTLRLADPLDSAAELTATLAVLRKAVESGEIDAQIEAVSAVVRRGFKR